MILGGGIKELREVFQGSGPWPRAHTQAYSAVAQSGSGTQGWRTAQDFPRGHLRSWAPCSTGHRAAGMQQMAEFHTGAS